MPSTSAHFPETLLEALDHLALEKGVSRNRLIVEACRELVEKRRGWPDDFFDPTRFAVEDLEDLQASAKDFATDLLATRRSRDVSPL